MIETPSQNETRLIRIVATIRRLCEGRNNATGTVTLTAGATSTTVAFVNCAADSQVLLSPRSASAQAAGAWISDVRAGQFTIAHAASSAADQVMGYVCAG